MKTFIELGVSEATAALLAARDISTPTPIQEGTIPLLLNGEHDVIGQALTGTGKTLAFAVPIVEKLVPGAGIQALVLTPTRELCMQDAAEISTLRAKGDAAVAAVYGGQFIDLQLRKLERGVDIVVGTPGRVLDLIERGALDLSKIRFAVLDEADEMLDMGFIEDIEKILEKTPAEKRTLLFSATMPEEIRRIADKFLHECEVVNVREEATNSALTRQLWCEVRREEKPDALARLLELDPDMYALIFCRTRADVDELVEKLHFRSCHVEALHGEISQAQRTRVIAGFKQRRFKLLVATDVAARGIDVNDLTHVINYSLPQSSEIYIHRIGRTGRAGKNGEAITFATPGESRKLKRIQDEIGVRFEKFTLPGPREVAAARREKFVARLAGLINSGDHECCREFATELLFKNDPIEVMAAIIKDAYGQEFLPEHYRELGAARRPARRESWPRPDRPGDFPPRERAERPKRDYAERPKRDYDERPKRDYAERPKRDYAERPKRDYAERPKRDYAERPEWVKRPQRYDRTERPPRKEGAKRDRRDKSGQE